MGRKIGAFGLINYRRHPSDQNYIVFNFNSEREAELFERELQKTHVWFEKDTEEVEGKVMYLFAVEESNLDKANRANGIVRTVTKEPLLKNKLLRYSLFIFLGALLILAAIGYVKNKEKVFPPAAEEQTDSLNLNP